MSKSPLLGGSCIWIPLDALATWPADLSLDLSRDPWCQDTTALPTTFPRTFRHLCCSKSQTSLVCWNRRTTSAQDFGGLDPNNSNNNTNNSNNSNNCSNSNNSNNNNNSNINNNNNTVNLLKATTGSGSRNIMTGM